MNNTALLNKYLQQSSIYGEYGAGQSTITAAGIPTIQEIHSVESDKQWIEQIQRQLARPVTFYYKEMGTQFQTWGHPSPTATEAQRRAYSNPIPVAEKLDLVLIDGRFRVATALKLHEKLSDTAIVAFDDFLNRPQYHCVLDYYTVLERGETMIICKRNGERAPSADLIQHYELVVD